MGEVGLTGEVRTVNQAEKRVMEAKRMGFKKCILPLGNRSKNLESGIADGMELMFADTVEEALNYMF